ALGGLRSGKNSTDLSGQCHDENSTAQVGVHYEADRKERMKNNRRQGVPGFHQFSFSVRLLQFSLRLDTGTSNCAISAVCRALPLKVSTLPSAEIITRSPS